MRYEDTAAIKVSGDREHCNLINKWIKNIL